MEIKIHGITDKQKLQAIEYTFYQGAKWEPKVGDYYTIVRNDNQLCRIVSEDENNFYIQLSWPDGQVSNGGPFPKYGFNTIDFGLNRIQCPDWIFKV